MELEVKNESCTFPPLWAPDSKSNSLKERGNRRFAQAWRTVACVMNLYSTTQLVPLRSVKHETKRNEPINYNILAVPTSRGVKRRARRGRDPRAAVPFLFSNLFRTKGGREGDRRLDLDLHLHQSGADQTVLWLKKKKKKEREKQAENVASLGKTRLLCQRRTPQNQYFVLYHTRFRTRT